MQDSTKPAKKSSITASDDLVADLVVELLHKTSKLDILQAENLALKAQLGAFATKEPVLTPKNPTCKGGPICADAADSCDNDSGGVVASDSSDASDTVHSSSISNTPSDAGEAPNGWTAERWLDYVEVRRMISKSLLEHSPASATHPGASEAEKVLALDAMSVHDAIKAVVLDLEEAVIEGVSQLRATEEVGASTLMLGRCLVAC